MFQHIEHDVLTKYIDPDKLRSSEEIDCRLASLDLMGHQEMKGMHRHALLILIRFRK